MVTTLLQARAELGTPLTLALALLAAVLLVIWGEDASAAVAR